VKIMKITGATKIETRKLIAELEKHGKKASQKIFLAVAEQLSKPRRQRVEVNLQKLSRIAEANKKKTIVVPGKVLSIGNAVAGIEIAALNFSSGAQKKILEAKGKAISLKQLVESKAKPSEMVLVK